MPVQMRDCDDENTVVRHAYYIVFTKYFTRRQLPIRYYSVKDGTINPYPAMTNNSEDESEKGGMWSKKRNVQSGEVEGEWRGCSVEEQWPRVQRSSEQ